MESLRRLYESAGLRLLYVDEPAAIFTDGVREFAAAVVEDREGLQKVIDAVESENRLRFYRIDVWCSRDVIEESREKLDGFSNVNVLPLEDLLSWEEEEEPGRVGAGVKAVGDRRMEGLTASQRERKGEAAKAAGAADVAAASQDTRIELLQWKVAALEREVELLTLLLKLLVGGAQIHTQIGPASAHADRSTPPDLRPSPPRPSPSASVLAPASRQVEQHVDGERRAEDGVANPPREAEVAPSPDRGAAEFISEFVDGNPWAEALASKGRERRD